MDLKFSEADLTFRQEVVNFLEAEYPEDIKAKQDKRIPLEKDEIVRWQKILNQKGWFAIQIISPVSKSRAYNPGCALSS